MLAVAVRREASGGVESCLAGRDDVEEEGREDAAEDLGDDVAYDFLRGIELSRSGKAEGDCRVEVAAGDPRLRRRPW